MVGTFQILIGIALIVLGVTLISSVGYIMLISSFAGGWILTTGFQNMSRGR